MPNDDEILDYDAYDADWEENMSMYYDYNLLDLLEETSDDLLMADASYYDVAKQSEELKEEYDMA